MRIQILDFAQKIDSDKYWTIIQKGKVEDAMKLKHAWK